MEIEKSERADLLTGRGLEALVALLIALLICIVGAAPNINRAVLASFILVVAAESAISPVRALGSTRGRREISKATLPRLLTATALTLIMLLTGVTLAAGHGGGFLWLPAAFVLSVSLLRSAHGFCWSRSCANSFHTTVCRADFCRRFVQELLAG